MVDVKELRAKWLSYDERLARGNETEGSLLGAAYIVARSGVTDVGELCDEIERLQEIEKKARGLVRTSGVARYSEMRDGEVTVVPQWWNGLKEALSG